MPTVGELIRSYRLAKVPKISQEHLGELIGKDQNYISFVETGRIKVPATSILDDLARALAIPLAEMYEAAGFPSPEPPASSTGESQAPVFDHIQSIREQLGSLRSELLSIEGVVPTTGIAVKFLGRVPADSVRWVRFEEGNEVRDVLPSWLGARAPENCFVVQASGDCLLLSAAHIASGDYVLLARITDQIPADGTVVLVRLGDEYSLKLWFREGEWIVLRTGDGDIVERVPARDVQPIGVFMRRWGP